MSLSERIVRHAPSTGSGSPAVWGIYDPDTGSVQYLCACPQTKQAALIDIVLDFDPAAAATTTQAVDQVMDLVAQEGLTVAWVLDTHPHADHVTASAELKLRTGAPNAIGAKVVEIAALWRGLYHLPQAFDPAQDYDRLLAPGDALALGTCSIQVMASPGHTLGSITYICGDAAFVHDTLMHVDVGSTRADFPGGSSAELWTSIQAILALPSQTRLFVGHDYGAPGRDTPQWEATVAQHRALNPHVADGQTQEGFTTLRDARDATLGLPNRMLAALQFNLRAGRMPPAEADGHSYLKIPLNKF